ncbi:MAG: xanthine dehydrogenase family protein molybdopterin-binding subunit [Spirochaetota bacterium]
MKFDIVGNKTSRLDAFEKVTGRAKYCGDVSFGGQLYAATVYSKYPHARILRIDSRPAEQLQGVVAVVSAADVPASNSMFGRFPVFAADEVKYVGDGVAAVAAESPALARRAAELVEVEYEQLPAVLDMESALEPGAELVHADEKGNLIEKSHHKMYFGDVAQGFEAADRVLERSYKTQFVDQMYIEPEAIIALPDPYRVGVEIHGSIQNPYSIRQNVAEVMGLKYSQVRVVQSTIGGSFGGKDESVMLMAARCAVMALKLKRPVKMVLTREESMLESPKRHAYNLEYKIGVKTDGTITAVEDRIYTQGGAYNNKAMFANWRGSVHAAGPYRVPHVKTDVYGVYTHTIFGGAYRGFSAPQIVFAAESLIDEVATELGMDPVEFRLKNCLQPGDQIATGQILDPAKMPANLEQLIRDVSERSDYEQRKQEYADFNAGSRELKRGIGIAVTFRGAGLGGEGIDTAGATITIEPDGSVNIQSGLIEMGQGMRTAHAQIVAEVLGIELERITFSTSDTSMVMDGGPTVASRGTLAGGRAMLDAAEKLQQRLKAVAAGALGCGTEEIEVREGRYCRPSDRQPGFSLDELITKAYREQGMSLSAQGWYNPGPEPLDHHTGQGNAYPSYIFGAAMPELRVDMNTGKITVEKVTLAYEIGRAINPKIVEGQIYGGFLQGLGYGLYEEIEQKNGYVHTLNFDNYMVPTIKDMPQFDLRLFESDPHVGPFGAKGVGEVGVELAAVSVANAVFNATGRRIRELPLNLERVLLGRALSK